MPLQPVVGPCYNSRLMRWSSQTAACFNKSILIYYSFDWLYECKYSAGKYIVLVTECLLQAPPCRPAGSELYCHSQLFIRQHIHSLSITALPPGPVTSLNVYCSVPPSTRRMIDAFGEDRGGTCAPLSLQSWLEGGGGSSSHTLIMSQLPDISETITVGGLLCAPILHGQVESCSAFLAHQGPD